MADPSELGAHLEDCLLTQAQILEGLKAARAKRLKAEEMQRESGRLHQEANQQEIRFMELCQHTNPDGGTALLPFSWGHKCTVCYTNIHNGDGDPIDL